MNLKVPGAILPLSCAILSTRAKLLGGLLQPPLGELGLNSIWLNILVNVQITKINELVHLTGR